MNTVEACIVCLAFAALVESSIRSLTPRTKVPTVSKLSDLRDAALSDQSAKVAADAASEAAKVADAAATSKANLSTATFAGAIKAKGGTVTDSSVSPPLLWTSADGLTFQKVTPPSIDDDAPDQLPVA